MLKIGEFARLAQVSIKTLRHYDKIGLLVPATNDPENGYRLYEMDQMADMMRILALKDCGFALDEIANLLNTHDSEAVAALVTQRIADQQQVVTEEQTRLQRLLARSQQLKALTDDVQHDFVLKQTEAYTLVGQRQTLPDQAAIASLVQAVLKELARQLIVPGDPLVHLYFDVECDEIDLFVGAPVMALPSSLDDLECQRIAAGASVASVLHRGNYTTIRQTGMALGNWVHHSGYQRIGPVYEIYHRSPAHTNNPGDYLTEIQFPISDQTLEHE
ncbi:MerR family transcriptional regulator [bacterium]|nr:MerR family transcriptional regulator [bacterium]